MAQDYTETLDDHGYSVAIEMSEIDSDTMTDAGVAAKDLFSIDDVMLTPGDPSPLGRTEDGDLAYPVFRDRENVRLSRREMGEISAHLPDGDLRERMIREALPAVLYPETAHGRIAREGDLKALRERRPHDVSLFD